MLYGPLRTRKNNDTTPMILSVPVSLNEILEKGYFSWPRPLSCGECGGSRLWGHGFVSAFFDEIDNPVWLKLYLCPDCNCVHRLRPTGYFKRFQTTVETIRSSIATRLETGRWPSGVSRCRAGHWLRALKQKTAAYLGQDWLGARLIEAFDLLVCMGKIPVSRSFKAASRPSETYPIEECRCLSFPAEIGPAQSKNEEAGSCTTKRFNGSQPSGSVSSTTSWATSSSHLENRNDSSRTSAPANGSSRSPPRPALPEARSYAGLSSTRAQEVNSKLSPLECAPIGEQPEPSTKKPGSH